MAVIGGNLVLVDEDKRVFDWNTKAYITDISRRATIIKKNVVALNQNGEVIQWQQ